MFPHLQGVEVEEHTVFVHVEALGQVIVIGIDRRTENPLQMIFGFGER